jgi:hypothetical protein
MVVDHMANLSTLIRISQPQREDPSRYDATAWARREAAILAKQPLPKTGIVLPGGTK